MTTFFRYIHITKIITLKIIVLLFFLGIQVQVSAQPVIVVSPNGGENWEAQESGTEQDLKSITFVNDKVGWAVGNSGVIIHTEDGGSTWSAQRSNTNRSLNKIFSLNDKEGWITGDEGIVLYTIDGGRKWEEVTPNCPACRRSAGG